MAFDVALFDLTLKEHLKLAKNCLLFEIKQPAGAYGRTDHSPFG
jgi:hypothetical protein